MVAVRDVPYRPLVAVPNLSYGDPATENLLIQGDNLDALKSLLPVYAGRVKCVYIDPPYNTRSAFEHYDDNREHSIWLSMMYPRLELLWELLCDDGVILISINDDEAHYLKVICDEVFNRKNFIASLVWNYEGNTDNQAKIINYHEYIFVYAKSGIIGSPKVIDPTIGSESKLHRPEIRNTIVKNGPKNPQKSVVIPAGFPCSFADGCIAKADVRFPQYSADIVVKNFTTQNCVTATTGWSSKEILENFVGNNFSAVTDSKGQQTTFEMTRTGAIEAVKKREQAKGHFLSVLRGFGTTNQMRIMLDKLGIKFTFPKPVNLISYLITAFTDENAIVLDSFSGSGTTAHAVLDINRRLGANLRFILVEREEQTAEKIIVRRLQSVIAGSRAAEIEATGGGFRFCRLGEPVFDGHGSIRSGVGFVDLARWVWYRETRQPLASAPDSPLLGIHQGTAYYLLYNGILGDRRPECGNVLTAPLLACLAPHDGPRVIFGEACRLHESRLAALNLRFRQLPYQANA